MPLCSWASVKPDRGSEVRAGELRACPGQNGGCGWKGGLDKGAEGLKCQTKDCEEPLVISEQGKQHEG